jgi:hypothetical protein
MPPTGLSDCSEGLAIMFFKAAAIKAGLGYGFDE